MVFDFGQILESFFPGTVTAFCLPVLRMPTEALSIVKVKLLSSDGNDVKCVLNDKR